MGLTLMKLDEERRGWKKTAQKVPTTSESPGHHPKSIQTTLAEKIKKKKETKNKN